MSTISQAKEFQLLGTEDELLVVMPFSHEAFVFKDAFFREFVISTCPTFCETVFGDREYISGERDITLELGARDCLKIHDFDINLLDYRLAKDMSVRQLFQSVRKKLNEREK